jgi:hypothetical protein
MQKFFSGISSLKKRTSAPLGRQSDHNIDHIENVGIEIDVWRREKRAFADSRQGWRKYLFVYGSRYTMKICDDLY